MFFPVKDHLDHSYFAYRDERVWQVALDNIRDRRCCIGKIIPKAYNPTGMDLSDFVVVDGPAW